jgi:type IV secretion system protein VirB9
MSAVLGALWLGVVLTLSKDEPGVAAVAHDSRIRSMIYDPDRIYRLRGYVGYQIDLEFESGESFVGVAAGDLDGIGYAAQSNHLFIKPKSVRVRTNLTILTTRRSYHIDYEVVSSTAPEGQTAELVYALRFMYAAAPPSETREADSGPELERMPEPTNRDYWYCGSPTLQPSAAFDDGVHTYLRFDARSELPAIFVRNDDGSESLLNFNLEHGQVVIHRVAQRLVIRRGRLQGCIVNRGFAGGRELQSGTISSGVERATRSGAP